MTNRDTPSSAAPRAVPRSGGSGASARGGRGSAKARRKAARLTAVQALYQVDLTGANPESVLGEFMKHRIGEDIDGPEMVAPDPQLFADILRGTMARKGEVDDLIRGALDPAYTLERLELLLRAILRSGVFELLNHVDVHPRITISEYVDVARAFFAKREPAMVNAVLDRLAHRLRASEMTADRI